MTARAAEERQWRARLYALEGRFDDFCREVSHVPHEAQASVYEAYVSGVKRLVLDFGRRTGKTTAGAMLASFVLCQDKTIVWAAAPEYDLTHRVWDVVTEVLIERLGFKPSARRNSDPRVLEFPWGSRLEGHSTGYTARNRMIGEAIDLLVWDECAKSPGSLWETKLQPNLGDRNGAAMLISTPEGYNHFYDWYMRGQGQDPDWRSWRANCIVNFGNVPNLRAVMAEAERTFTTEAYHQEWLGEFTHFAGRVYPEFSDDVNTGHVRPCPYDPDLPLYLAFDFGTTNPFVCLWFQTTSDDCVRVIDEWSSAEVQGGREVVLRQGTTQEYGEAVLRHHAAEKYARWRDAAADPSGKDQRLTLLRHCWIKTRYQRLSTKGQRVRETASGIERIRRLLKERRLFVDPRCTLTIFEFSQYRYPEKPEERDAAEEPQKINDHAMDALRYGVNVWLGPIGSQHAVRAGETRESLEALPQERGPLDLEPVAGGTGRVLTNLRREAVAMALKPGRVVVARRRH